MSITNFVKTCAKNAAGNSKVFTTEAANVTDGTVTAGEVSAITMATGTTFHEIDCNSDSIRRVQEEHVSNNAVFINHRIDFVIQKPSTTLNTLRSSIFDALTCGIIAIVLDNNGQSWLVGWNETSKNNNPLNTMESSVDSGISSEEQEMQSWTAAIAGKSGYYDLPLDSTLNAAVVDGSSALITWN